MKNGLLSLALLAGCLIMYPTNIYADNIITDVIDYEEYENADYSYVILEDDTVQLIKYLGNEIVVNVPEEIDGHVVAELGKGTFVSNKTISDISLPNTLTKVDGTAFEGCENLHTISVNPQNPELVMDNNTLFSKSDKRLVWHSGALNEKDYAIPEGIEIIGAGAFYQNRNLETVSIPETVSVIENDAFYGCYSLSSIQLPDSITEIGIRSFYYCKGATEIELSKQLSVIPKMAFSNCENLVSIDIPESVTEISDMAFMSCSGLTSIIIPPSVTVFGEQIFEKTSYGLTITVTAGSEAEKYCSERNVSYVYADNMDWLK